MTTAHRLRRLATVICLFVIGSVALATPPRALAFSVSEWNPPTTPAPHAQIVSDLTALDSQVLADFMSNTAAGRSYSNGVWTNPVQGCASCLDSAATAAAILYRQGGESDPTLLTAAVATYNTLIRSQQADGSFPGNPQTNPPITTEFLLPELGTTYFEIKDKLNSATSALWSTAIQRAADYLISSGQTTWYANGNIQLRLVEDMWLAWKITGLSRFQTAYNSEWSFAMTPPQLRWAGFGLHVTKAPNLPDGSDGSAYLAESNGGTPGFDPVYTMTQLDTATGMWVLSRDPMYLRLMNMLLNQLLPRVDSQWTLDATGGSRKSVVLPFYDVAPAVLVAEGSRPDLALGASVQLWRLEWEFTNVSLYDNPNYYKGLSGWVSVPLLDAQWPNGVLRRGATSPHMQGAPFNRGVVVTPSAPSSSSLSNPGLRVTVTGAKGTAVHVTIVRATPVARKSAARLSSAHVLATAAGTVGRSRRLMLRIRLRRPELTRGRRIRGIAVEVALASPGRHRWVVGRRLLVRGS